MPGLEARFTVSEVFAFTAVLLFGPEAGAVTLALDSLVLAWHRRMQLNKAAFNFGNLTLAVWVSGTLFFRVSGIDRLLGGGGPAAELLVPLALLGTTYFVVNTGLLAVAIGIDTAASPLLLWRRHFLALAPGYAASASLALLLVLALQTVHLVGVRAAGAAAAGLLLHVPVLVRTGRGREGPPRQAQHAVSVHGGDARHRNRRQGRSHPRAHPARPARRDGPGTRARGQGRRKR